MDINILVWPGKVESPIFLSSLVIWLLRIRLFEVAMNGSLAWTIVRFGI